MQKLEQLYEGKAKKVFKTEDEDIVIVDYKDDATAFNGEKKGTIAGKGVINNKMTNFLFKKLEEEGIPTHLVEEGTKLACPTLEFSYKDDALNDPMINDYYAIAIGAATREEIDKITEYVFKINDYLLKFFAECGLELIDFKVEFGRFHGDIILADEISPDTCRFWDIKTREKLDKDRFRRDLGNVEDAYNEVAKRIGLI